MRRSGSSRERPSQIGRRFAARLTRALPLDEVLLQLAEVALHGVEADGVEVWVARPADLRAEDARVDGLRYEPAAVVPSRDLDPLLLDPAELEVLRTPAPRGSGWLEVWLPAVAARFDGAPVRLAPMVHQGEVLGLLIAQRRSGRRSFGDRDDLVLADLARQTAVALHHSRLDSALTDTVHRLRETNDELRSSRARLVSAAEAERRRLERDLHDGAQQHLVAVSVKVLLARQALEHGDQGAAALLLDELQSDAGLALQELRVLAHGLYPTELATGLADALQVISDRAPVPVRLDLDGVGRYEPSIEACCYFCCAEAVANAAKHAGSARAVDVRLHETEGHLILDVVDDGPGFPTPLPAGHGVQNLIDRTGVLGGDVTFRAASPHGAWVRVRLPLGDPPVADLP